MLRRNLSSLLVGTQYSFHGGDLFAERLLLIGPDITISHMNNQMTTQAKTHTLIQHGYQSVSSRYPARATWCALGL